MRGTTTRGKRITRIGLALAVVAVALVVLMSGSALAAPPWSDAPNSWWISTYNITETQAASVADGWPDHTFRPAIKVNRAQFAKMAVAGLGVPTAYPSVASFPDVPLTNYFSPWIEGGVAGGLIAGQADGTFGPNKTIIRQQANSILGNYLAQKELTLRGHLAGKTANYPSLNTWYVAEGMGILAQFADANRVAAVHAPATAYLVYRGVVQGAYTAGLMFLGPELDLTRGQAVALVLRVKAVTFSTALPTVASLNPSSGLPAGGNTVVITGTNFTDVFAVRFGGVNATYTVNSATKITAVAPAGTLGSTVDVTVETAAGTSAKGTATKYVYGLPTVTGLSPASGPTQGGNTVLITGTNLTGATAVKFGTKPATSFNVVSSTQISAVAPSGSGTVDVTVVTPGGTTATSLASKYSYGAPTVTGLSPTTGPAAGGTTVTITGTGFSGVSSVKFGTKNAASFTVTSPTTITAVTPVAVVGIVDVTVTTPAGTSTTSSSTKFTYTGPVITLLAPAAGPLGGGNIVTITGTGFTNVSSVTFGGKTATFVVDSSTQIRATAPSASTNSTVDVVVTTSAGASATGDATKYTYGIPVITSLDPSWGPAEGGTLVTVNGGGFVNVTAVKFGGVNATSFHVYSATMLTAVSPAGTDGSTVQVTVTANGGTSSTSGTANDFTYGAGKFVITRSGTTTSLTGLSRTAGQTLALRITAEDPSGDIIDNFTGTVVLTSNAWNGSVSVNMTDGVKDNVVVTPKIAGTLRYITATYGSIVTTNASGNFTVTAASVSKLQVLLPGEAAAPGTTTGKTGTANSQAAGVAFNIVVNAVDAYWNVVTSVSDAVHLTSSDGAATMPLSDLHLSLGTRTISVTLNTAGSQTITADDTTNGAVANGTSSSVTVTSFAHLVIVVPGETLNVGTAPGKTGSPTDRTAGQTFNVDVYAMDSTWHVVTGVTDTIRLTTTCPNRSLPSDTDMTSGHVQLSVNLYTKGTAWTITATDLDAGVSVTSAAIKVVAAGLDHFGWATISGTKTAGTNFLVTLTAYDVYNNVKSDYAGTPALTVSNGGTVSPAAPAPGEWSNGVWAHNVYVTKAGTGIHLTAVDAPANNNSGTFNVVAGAPTQVTDRQWRTTSGPGAWTGSDPGAPLASGTHVDLRMQLADAYGNPCISVNVSAAHPWFHYEQTVGGSATGGTAPSSSTTDSEGYVIWTNRGGYTDATYRLWLGLDTDAQGDPDEGGLWSYFTIVWAP
jgi:hypothetical protein